jgi:hypothetical protein
MFQDSAVSAVSMPWVDVTDADYDAACAACEIKVALSAHDIVEVTRHLFYDTSKKGSRGRSLRNNIPRLHLIVGDRLEPSSTLRDVAQFEAVAPGTIIVFWRSSKQTRTHHRNPLFDVGLGISITLLCVDLLHAFHLGVMKEFANSLSGRCCCPTSLA